MAKRVRFNKTYLRFKAWLVENNIKQKVIAELLGIDVVTLNQKLNGWSDFTYTEVEIICDHYNLSADLFRRNKVA